MHRRMMMQSIGGGVNLFQDASIALSLRDLGLGATHVVRVRRDSDNTEQDFTATEITDGTLTSFCGAGNGFVSIWYDQSPSQNNLINSIISTQARVIDAGSLVLDNGKPAVKFNSGNVMESIDIYPTQTDQCHFYVANSIEANNRVLDTRGTGVGGAVKGWQSKFNNNTVVTLFDDGSGNSISVDIIIRNSQSLVSILGSQSLLKEYTNSILEGSSTGNIGSFNSGNKLYVSGNANGQNTQLFVGTIQEIICFNTDKSVERTDIETNINNFYNIY